MLDLVPESLVGSMRGECAGMSPASRDERELEDAGDERAQMNAVATLTTRAIEAARVGQRVRVMTADGRVHEGKINWDSNPNTSLPIFMLDQADAGWMGLVSGVRTDLRVVSLDVLPVYVNSIEPGQRVSTRASDDGGLAVRVKRWLGRDVVITMFDGWRVGGRLASLSGDSDERGFALELTGLARVLRSHVPDSTVPENIVDIELADVGAVLRWHRIATAFMPEGDEVELFVVQDHSQAHAWAPARAVDRRVMVQAERVVVSDGKVIKDRAATTTDDEWIEVTSLEQAKALDGRLVEIDASNVASSWDASTEHGQTRRCVWEAHVLRAGSHGPLLWATTRRPDGLRLRVVEEKPETIRACCVTARVGDVLRLEHESDVQAVMGCEVTWSDRNESGTVSGTVRLLGDVRVQLAEGSQTLCLPVTVRIVKTVEQSSHDRAATVVTCNAEPYDLYPDEMSKTEQQAHDRSFRGNQTKGCERCCFTGVLVGFTSPDRPCDAVGCTARKTAVKSEGPKEWEVVGRAELVHDDEFAGQGWESTYEFVLAQKGEQRIGFIVADYRAGRRETGTAMVQLRDHKVFGGTPITVESVRRQWQEGKPFHTAAVHGERCRDMVVDRLVCALRDGSVKP
jgi:hypothetical protein